MTVRPASSTRRGAGADTRARRADGHERRNRIIEAAIEFFAEKGYRGTSIADIGRALRADIERGTLTADVDISRLEREVLAVLMGLEQQWLLDPVAGRSHSATASRSTTEPRWTRRSSPTTSTPTGAAYEERSPLLFTFILQDVADVQVQAHSRSASP